MINVPSLPDQLLVAKRLHKDAIEFADKIRYGTVTGFGPKVFDWQGDYTCNMLKGRLHINTMWTADSECMAWVGLLPIRQVTNKRETHAVFYLVLEILKQ